MTICIWLGLQWVCLTQYWFRILWSLTVLNFRKEKMMTVASFSLWVSATLALFNITHVESGTYVRCLDFLSFLFDCCSAMSDPGQQAAAPPGYWFFPPTMRQARATRRARPTDPRAFLPAVLLPASVSASPGFQCCSVSSSQQSTSRTTGALSPRTVLAA